MERRTFSKLEKQAVELVTGQSGDADHIQPFSKGGQTAVENCQLINPRTNKKKGAFQFSPRQWQVAFLNQWERRGERQPFLLIAIPGGGKTMAALEACRRWMDAGPDRRIIVVVPTVNLREQWKDEATRFGIDLQTKEFGTNFKDGYRGGVTTYQSVASNPAIYRKLCSVAPTMVVFDEIHHCGDDKQFGIGIKTGFEQAREHLAMSGTPWNPGGEQIPFVKYDANGYAIGDYRYDYPDALKDDVVRYLVFDHTKGTIKDDCTGETEVLSQDVSDDDAKKRLRKLLDPEGDYVREQIQSAHRKLMECRRTIHDAAALAACVDQFHAAKIAALIREVTGCEPSLIVSDGELENDSVKSFRKSRKEWLVAVRKVSEGTDIQRLQVLCYLTNTTSELFFRQLIGRVSRVRGMEDFEAYVYLPADPRLIRCAQNIENAQVQALRDVSEMEARQLSERQQGVLKFDSYSTSHDGTDVLLIGNERVPIDQAKAIERIAELVGVSMQKVMEIQRLSMQTPGEHHAAMPLETSKEDRMATIRKKCNKTAFRLSVLLGVDVKEVHGRFRPQHAMTEQELQSKLDQLVRECNRR